MGVFVSGLLVCWAQLCFGDCPISSHHGLHRYGAAALSSPSIDTPHLRCRSYHKSFGCLDSVVFNFQGSLSSLYPSGGCQKHGLTPAPSSLTDFIVGLKGDVSLSSSPQIIVHIELLPFTLLRDMPETKKRRNF